MRILRKLLLTNTADAANVMMQSPFSSFDNIAGGKVGVPSWNFNSQFGNPNDVGADTQFGSGQAIIGGEGNIDLSAGTGIQPFATGSEVVLATYVIPANSYDVAGRGITATAAGSLVSGTGSPQRVRIWFNTGTATAAGALFTAGNASVIADTAAVAGGGAQAWQIQALIFKYGAAGSNTQIGIHGAGQVGGTMLTLVNPTLLTAIEGSPIGVAVTCIGSGVVGNINLDLLEITASN